METGGKPPVTPPNSPESACLPWLVCSITATTLGTASSLLACLLIKSNSHGAETGFAGLGPGLHFRAQPLWVYPWPDLFQSVHHALFDAGYI